jgi:hypothetical protein
VTVLRTSYRPSVHGFRFGNDFHDQVLGPTTTRGRCHGLCAMSLDYFHAALPAPAVDVVDYGTRPVSGLSAVSWSAQHAALFVRRDTGIIVTKTFDGSTYSDWRRLFGAATTDPSTAPSGPPVAASWGPDRIDLITSDTTTLWHHRHLRGSPGPGPGTPSDLAGEPWASAYVGLAPPSSGPVPAAPVTAPALAAPCADRLEAYVVDANGDLWFRDFDGMGFDNSRNFNERRRPDDGGASGRDGALGGGDGVGGGRGGAFGGTGDPGGGWRDWTPLGRPPTVTLTSDPAAAGRPGWRSALVRGDDNAIWQREWAADRWLPWRSLGGTMTSAPALCSPFPGRAEAYACGGDGNLYHAVYDATRWSRWTSLGAPPPGLTTHRPAAISHHAVMDVYALASDQTVWHRRWSAGWQPWLSTEIAVTSTSRRLTDAILDRTLVSTTGPPSTPAALDVGPLARRLVGTAVGYVQLPPLPDRQLFDRATGVELSTLAAFVRDGTPIPIGLLGLGRCGHEMVCYGCDLEPGGRSRLQVYDPNHPGRDDVSITIDEQERTITSSDGESWRTLWVRSDFVAQEPAV